MALKERTLLAAKLSPPYVFPVAVRWRSGLIDWLEGLVNAPGEETRVSHRRCGLSWD